MPLIKSIIQFQKILSRTLTFNEKLYLEMPVHVVGPCEGRGAVLVRTVHGDTWKIMKLDVADDEGRFDVLEALWTF